MWYPDILKTGLFAGVIAVSAIAAQAATVEFSSFASTNSYQLSPTVILDDDTAGQITFTISISAPDVGSLIGVFVDVDGPKVTESAITDGSFNHIDFRRNTLNLGNGANLNNSNASEFDFGLKYDKNDQIGLTPLTFMLSDYNGAITLSDFTRIGLRFKQSNNNEQRAGRRESDKLISSSQQPMAPVPLPAAGLLMIGALGGLIGLRRRKHA